MLRIALLSIGLSLSFFAHSEIVNCKFDNMDKYIKFLISGLEPYKTCKQAIDLNQNILGYVVKKNKSSLSIAFGGINDFLPSHLSVKGKRVSIMKIFTSIYVKGNKPLNNYIAAQRTLLDSASSYGVVNVKKQHFFFQLDSKPGAYLNSFSVVSEGKPNEYVQVSSPNKKLLIAVLLKGINKND